MPVSTKRAPLPETNLKPDFRACASRRPARLTGSLVVGYLHSRGNDADPEQDLGQSGQLRDAGGVNRLAPISRLALYHDMPRERERNEHAQLPLKRDVLHEAGGDSRKQHESAGQYDGEADPVPGEKLLRHLRGRRFAIADAEKAQIQGEVGSQPDRQPREVDELHEWI